MTFKLGTIFVLAQVILLAFAMPPNLTGSTNSTEMATDSYGCYKKGELWKDLGTNESIVQAYDEQWCKYNVGWWALGVTVKNAAGRCLSWNFQLIYSKGNLCVRDDPIKHAFKWKWKITEIPDGKDVGYISHVSVPTLVLLWALLARF